MSEKLRLPEVAVMVGVDPSSLRRWCEAGKGPVGIRTPLGHWIFERSDVDEWIMGLQIGEPPAPEPGTVMEPRT